MSARALHPIVIWFGRVGDMIMLSALLHVLRRRYGGTCRVVGAGAWSAEIYRSHPDVAAVWWMRRYTPLIFDVHAWRVLWALRRSCFDPVYVCETDPRKLARIRRLLKLSGADPARCVFITDDEVSGQERHWVDRLVRLGQQTPRALRESEYPSRADAVAAPRLEVSAAARAQCDAWIDAQGWRGKPLVLVQPGNRRTMRGRKLRVSALDDKAWPIERWAALLRKIHAHMPDAVILLCGAPRETLLLGWIEAATHLPVLARAELPLGQLLALCQSAHSMISVDTGPAHAAAALGLPLVVLFGAQSPQEWLPRSANGSPVFAVGGPPTATRLDQISAETVFETWRSLIQLRDPQERHPRTAMA